MFRLIPCGMSQVEAPVDPFDALASILPSAEPVAPPQPVFTGPEVTEVQLPAWCERLSGLGCSMDLL